MKIPADTIGHLYEKIEENGCNAKLALAAAKSPPYSSALR
jgi:hypothetical protein